MVQKLPSSHEPPPAAEGMSVALSLLPRVAGHSCTAWHAGVRCLVAVLEQRQGQQNPPAASGYVVQARGDPRFSSPPPTL